MQAAFKKFFGPPRRQGIAPGAMASVEEDKTDNLLPGGGLRSPQRPPKIHEHNDHVHLEVTISAYSPPWCFHLFLACNLNAQSTFYSEVMCSASEIWLLVALNVANV